MVQNPYQMLPRFSWSLCNSLGCPAIASRILQSYHVEGDLKFFFYPLSSKEVTPYWSIANIMCNTLSFKSRFSWCLFRWIKRECNMASHAAAKLSLNAKKTFVSIKKKKQTILWFINGHKSKANTCCTQVIMHALFFN